MRPPPDSIQPISAWHLDCRIESELPDDSIVGKRFLLNTGAGVFAAIALLLAAWMGFRYQSINQAIADWDARIAANQQELAAVERLRQAYALEASKIDYAYALMRQDFPIHVFAARIARTRPPTMTIDSIEATATGALVRGYLREESEIASRALGIYAAQLRTDDELNRYFREVNIANLDRRLGQNLLSFELIFTKR